jgi:uncharacterized membrane protein
MENSSGKSALGLDPNVAAGLAYLPICGINLIMSIIILVTDKTNKLPRFHAFQSLLLLGVSIVLYFLVAFIYGILLATQSGALAILGSLLFLGVALAILGAIIFCCVKAFQGQMFKLPVIGDMADKWSN